MIVCAFKDLPRYAPVLPGLEEVIRLVKGLEDLQPATYPLENGGRVMVQQGTTRPVAEALSEAHRDFLDVQCILEGSETVGWAEVSTLTEAVAYDAEQDIAFYNGDCEFITVKAGYCYIVFPEDAHMPCVHLDAPQNYRKAVAKLRV